MERAQGDNEGLQQRRDNEDSWLPAATRRVDADAELAMFAEVLLYEWEREGEDHWRWVAEAPVEELLDWAEVVSKD